MLRVSWGVFSYGKQSLSPPNPIRPTSTASD
jgi:hypothetical protein